LLSGIFRRRNVVIAAALVMAGALGAGLPPLAWHNAQDSAQAATATITLQVSGIPGVSGTVDLSFASFGGIRSDIQDRASCSTLPCTYEASPVPPTITLTDPFAAHITAYQDMFKWQQAYREGNPEGRQLAILTLTNPATGKTIATYGLESGWPTNVDVSAGNPQSADFTVTLTGDALVLSSVGS
jgi:hypothetical protein